MPVFFISSNQITHGQVTITGPLCDHLRGSLRVTDGEEFWVGDEQRRRYLVKALQVTKQAILGSILEERAGPSASSPPITLAATILKGDRMDWIIQKTTELGIATLVPLVAEQGIVRPRPSRSDAQRERWQRIAFEAAQQSERWDVPTVTSPVHARDFFAGQPAQATKFILTERCEGASLQSVALPAMATKTIIIAVGPEGGWRDEEADQAIQHGFRPVTLGPRILRAETAAAAAVSIVQSRLGELG
ncbi:MAG: 16S rRNA (uracil(1498)-N(3))-methyltransferase [Nitrospirota bacterium]|nr:16S rRNA (uracil(1498)-N(3))-methyltransferase [Nitrospirota bacterium]